MGAQRTWGGLEGSLSTYERGSGKQGRKDVCKK